MNNYNDVKWQNDMKIRLDYNNMMAEFVGDKEGYTDKDLEKAIQILNK